MYDNCITIATLIYFINSNSNTTMDHELRWWFLKFEKDKRNQENMKFDNNKLPLFPNSDKYLRENESETDDSKMYSIQENNAITG